MFERGKLVFSYESTRFTFFWSIGFPEEIQRILYPTRDHHYKTYGLSTRSLKFHPLLLGHSGAVKVMTVTQIRGLRAPKRELSHSRCRQVRSRSLLPAG